MIKAVIFDCFGVLTTDGWKRIREEFFAHDPSKMQHANEIDKAVNAGFMDYDDFIDEISYMTKLSSTDIRARMNGSEPNDMLFEYIRDKLKPHYKIGMLSNAADNWLGEMFEPWQVALFDEVVLSYKVGVAKPHTLIYETVVNQLDVTMEESIFIDDSERYVIAARDLGMNAINHIDTPDTITQLEKLLHA